PCDDEGSPTREEGHSAATKMAARRMGNGMQTPWTSETTAGERASRTSAVQSTETSDAKSEGGEKEWGGRRSQLRRRCDGNRSGKLRLKDRRHDQHLHDSRQRRGCHL